jgi:calcineurin-like phosphoesterase family protein
MHGNILRYGRGEFSNLREMNEHLVEEWNKVVPEDALVFDLGDISIGDSKATLRYLEKLNGFIIHLKGNHNNQEEYDMFQEALKEKHIFKNTPTMEVKINGQLIVMCHYPFAVWNKQHHGSWHLFGHSHGTLPVNNKKTIDVGIDSIKNIFGQYRPVSLQEIRSIMETRVNNTDDHHLQN